MSKELIEAIESYENYISANGITEEAISAFILAAETAINKEKDKEYGFKVTARAKELIETFVLKATGGTIWDLESYCNKNKVSYGIFDQYYSVLKIESNDLFDSYLLYLEKNRDEEERFYLPKREQLTKHGLIQAMQDLEDDKLDILSISMPPGTQKTTLEKFFSSWIIGRHP